MARKNRAANRAANREPTAEQKEQEEFIEELSGEDFNPDLDEPEEDDDDGGEGNEEVTELEEQTQEEREAEAAAAKAKTAEPNVKTEEEGNEAGKQKEVTSLDDDEDDGEEGDEAGVTKTPEELEAEAKAKAEEAPKPEPTAEEIEAQQKKELEEAEAKVASLEAEQKPLTDEEAAKVFTEWRQTTEELLAQHHYALTPEMIEEYEENPAALIPKLMSRVYMDSISAAFNQFTNYLPRMVGMVLEQRESMNAAEKAFFDKWPDLLNHRDAVLRHGQAYRSANPQASMDDFINEVGAMTMVGLRLNPANVNGNGQVQQTQQQKPKPFKPAVETPSSGGPKKREGNVFEQLSQDFDTLEEEADFE